MLFFFGLLAAVILLVAFFKSDCDLTLAFWSKIPLKSDSFKNKVVWITGASSGIGEYLAYDLASRGATLILSARREAELIRVQQAIAKAFGAQVKVHVSTLDVLDMDSHAPIVQQLIQQCGHIDYAVLNAGRSQRALAEESDLKMTREIFELNVFGQISLAKAILPHFLQRRSGHFVVTSSVSGKLGAPCSSSYSATKFALHGYFEALRSEVVNRNVGVTMVCPGPVRSNIVDHAFRAGAATPEDHASKMPTERCARLMAVAMARKLGEVWIAYHPVLFFVYVVQYMPDIGRLFARVVGPSRVRAFKSGGDFYDQRSFFGGGAGKTKSK